MNSPSSVSQSYNDQHRELLECQQNAYNPETEELDISFVGNNVEEANEIEAPTTPIKKHVPMSWHGLLSPQTPGFAKHSPEAPAICSSDDTTGSNTYEPPNDTEVGKIALQDVLTSANESLGKGTKYVTAEQTQIAIEELQQGIPNPDNAFPDAGAACEKDKDGDDSHVIEDHVEHDTTLARELEKSPSPAQTRRSARLRSKPKPECQFTGILLFIQIC